MTWLFKTKIFAVLFTCGFLLALSSACYADLSATELTAMLSAHNQVRSGVTPTAANMTRLVWDSNLATVAQNWANQCNWSHNPGRNAAYAALSSNSGQVGENIYVTTAPRASALSGSNGAVALWAAEVSAYNYATNTCAAGQVCGHYTQLVWANTLRVGCGVTQCPSLAGLPGFSNAQFVVCDYNPAGNFIGQSPYVSGVTGSQCPASLPNAVDGLCSPAASSPITKAIPALPAFALAVLAFGLVSVGWFVSAKRSAKLSSLD